MYAIILKIIFFDTASELYKTNNSKTLINFRKKDKMSVILKQSPCTYEYIGNYIVAATTGELGGPLFIFIDKLIVIIRRVLFVVIIYSV